MDMGVSLEVWRARIGGCFPGLHRAKKSMAAITLGRGCVHLILLFVHVFVILPYSTQCTASPSWSWAMDWLRDHMAVTSPPTHWTRVRGTIPLHGGLVWTPFCRDALQHTYPVYHQQTLLLSGEVELNPGPAEDFCPAACKHGRREAGEMIRCCLCAG